MKSISKILVAITVLLSFTVSNAQIKNAKTETVKIYGNCGMCKSTIEKAGNLKKVAKVDWNEDTKMATLTYDAKQTNQDEILKRIALAGYDSDKFLAPDDVYENLHGCCQYDREAKAPVKAEIKTDPSDSEQAKQMATTENHGEHANPTAATIEKQQVNQLKAVFDNYFAVKDALVKNNGTTASAKAKDLLTAINAVKMETLKMDVHMVWMKVMNELKEDAKHISDTQDVKLQRAHFMTLSKNMYELMKVSKTDTPTYYQFCPMANGGKGANWLSKENAIKNPYYGSMMLTCGKTVETIK
jgi:copper chaperone CopZ